MTMQFVLLSMFLIDCAACAASPCAIVPVVPDLVCEVSSSALSLATFTFLGVLIHLLLNIGITFSSNISFIPFNARLNTLVKKRKTNFIPGNHMTKYLNLSFIVFLLSEETASITISLEYPFLDLCCLLLISSIFNLCLSAAMIGVHSVTNIVLHHKNLFYPCFCYYEQTAF